MWHILEQTAWASSKADSAYSPGSISCRDRISYHLLSCATLDAYMNTEEMNRVHLVIILARLPVFDW